MVTESFGYFPQQLKAALKNFEKASYRTSEESLFPLLAASDAEFTE